MKSKTNFVNINDPIMFMKMEFMSLFFLTVSCALGLLIGMFICSLLGLPIKVILIPIVPFYIVTIILLHIGNKKKEKNYIPSLLSFFFFQPKKIKLYEPHRLDKKQK